MHFNKVLGCDRRHDDFMFALVWTCPTSLFADVLLMRDFVGMFCVFGSSAMAKCITY